MFERAKRRVRSKPYGKVVGTMEGIEYQKNMHIDMLSEPNDLEIWVCVCREVWL